MQHVVFLFCHCMFLPAYLRISVDLFRELLSACNTCSSLEPQTRTSVSHYINDSAVTMDVLPKLTKPQCRRYLTARKISSEVKNHVITCYEQINVYRLACDHALSLYLCNLFSGGGRSFFPSRTKEAKKQKNKNKNNA